jgi:D-glycero-alpha-D-manno-heptose 1-phosphate guanylyltransferase
MEAVILAGGLGTRLQSVVSHVPKPLAPILGRPFLDILLKHLPPLEKIVLAVGHKAGLITEAYQSSNIEFSIEDEPLGTGGALKKALSHIKNEHLLVLNGDSYVHVDYPAFFEAHIRYDADLTLVYIPLEETGRFGKIKIDPLTHQIQAFQEKVGGPGYVNAGVYLIRKSILDTFDGKFSLEKDVFPTLSRIYGFPSSGPFIDIGTPESYILAQTVLENL